MVVYIPTTSRIETLRKTVPYWLEQDMQVRLVVERNEYHPHNKLKQEQGWGKDVYILPLPLSGRGIGYARKYCVTHAKATNNLSIIMSDDDHYIAESSDAWELIDEAENPYILGIGATRSLHDRFTDGAISANSGVILCPGGWGFTVRGVNVENTLAVGNYDPALHSFGEDAELARRGIAQLGIPWFVHCDVKFVAVNKRYDPGGFSAKYRTLEARQAAERECLGIIHKRWPDYTSEPDKKPRMAWQKLLSHYIPEWRDYSVMHGGSTEKYRAKHEQDS